MSGRIVSLNVSGIKTFSYRGEEVETGIFKQPIQHPVMLRQLNLDGDQQADLRVHGGPYKAVYFYPWEHYEYWKQQLEREALPVGPFGENFTTEGLLESDVYLGNVYRIGEARVQITQPRAPCFKLAAYIQGPRDFAKQFLASGRTGFYGRVVQEGVVHPQDTIELIETHEQRISVRALNQLYYVDPSDKDLARQALLIDALPSAWRESLEKIATG